MLAQTPLGAAAQTLNRQAIFRYLAIGLAITWVIALVRAKASARVVFRGCLNVVVCGFARGSTFCAYCIVPKIQSRVTVDSRGQETQTTARRNGATTWRAVASTLIAKCLATLQRMAPCCGLGNCDRVREEDHDRVPDHQGGIEGDHEDAADGRLPLLLHVLHSAPPGLTEARCGGLVLVSPVPSQFSVLAADTTVGVLTPNAHATCNALNYG